MANNFDPSLSWSDDEIGSTSKLNSMVENTNIVYNLTPHFMVQQFSGAITDFNDSQTQVLKPTIFAGRTRVNSKWGVSNATREIAFPAGTFAANCQPIVIVSPAAPLDPDTSLTTAGLDGSRVIKSDGFRITARKNGGSFRDFVSAHYMVFGWQEA